MPDAPFSRNCARSGSTAHMPIAKILDFAKFSAGAASFSSSLFPSLFGRDKQVWYHSRGTERGNTPKASSSSRTCPLSPILIRIVEAKQPCGCINCIISHQKDVKNVPLQFFDFPSFFAQWRDGAGLFCACAKKEKINNKQITLQQRQENNV